MTRPLAGLACLVAAAGFCAISRAEPITLATDGFQAGIVNGSIVSLVDRSGRVMVQSPAEPRGAGIHSLNGVHWGTSVTVSARDSAHVAARLHGFSDLDRASIDMTFRRDPGSHELLVEQRAETSSRDIWGVSWSIAEIPLDYAILVPGASGVRLTADSPPRVYQYDYPLSWESQFVVVEGPGRGFYVWAEDAQGRFKRLTVERRPSGWRLGFATINNAPFERLAACESVRWRVGAYEGDWRVPARRYRDWSEAQFRPTPISRQKPKWVNDIRACVIMGIDQAVLEALPKRLDPRQTLLYLPGWRAAGYDRDYPDYDKPVPSLDPLIKRAHDLGFRVMLHVNYFGVDPLNPLYKEFEAYHVRDPFGGHEKQWWRWARATPPIKFAYINPASKKWRDYFTAAMVKLCRRTNADALHLDQTLCIFNDHNGLIDGMTMIEGNVALHKQLREALPEVALSGEGLNEITCRYEAFAQRHVWGLDHTLGTWDRAWLAAAHPVSSYVLRPYTVIYGYLGCAPPETDQLYAAWREAYEHWGVIPTLKPSLKSLAEPSGFARQFFDEAAFWQQERVEIDLDAPWPQHVAFPLRTASGQPAAHTVDGRLVCGSREISRTIRGVNEIELSGTIPGWRAFDEKRLFGLDPDRWYPYFTEPRQTAGFRVCELPAGLILDTLIETPDLAMIRTRSAVSVVADLGRWLDKAICGTRPFSSRGVEQRGPLVESADGGQFHAQAGGIWAHPPWKVAGSGETFARYELELPTDGYIEFLADVAIDPSAVATNKSDGVTFAARVQSQDHARNQDRVRGQNDLIETRLHTDTAQRRPLRLDLTPFAGKRVTVALSVGPGPKRNPSFDWARWFRPRIERRIVSQGNLAVASAKSWPLAIDHSGPVTVRSTGNVHRVEARQPGTVIFLAHEPEAARLPLDLSKPSWRVLILSDSGQEVSGSPFAGLRHNRNTVGGVERDGLFAHPPDHGRIVAVFPMRLPAAPARFFSYVGIRDGSRSDGVSFAVEVNGHEVARRRMVPGKWELLNADLSAWAAKPIVLSLVTDSDGSFDCDWAAWGEPRLE